MKNEPSNNYEGMITMNKVLGIIAEYNPFHKGHLHHLQKAKQLVEPDYTIAVMSGNFTQRGEPAVIDKWARTQMALKNGIDLVIELPALYASQTAELFSAGAIQLLHMTGLVTHIAFGSEHNNLDELDMAARVLAEEPAEYRVLLRSYLNKGLSYPFARMRAMQEYFSCANWVKTISSELIESIFRGSNSILALEYLKALKRLESPIKPVIIPRLGASYNSPSLEGEFSSATAIRSAILSGKSWDSVATALPIPSLEILRETISNGWGPVSIHSFDQILLGLLRRSSTEEISNWMDVEEGLENRIKKHALESVNIEDFLNKVKTKRYTYTRFQRILIHALLGIKTQDISYYQEKGGPRYLRILGFNTRSIPLLSCLKKRAGLPIITKPSHYYRYGDKDLCTMFQYDVLAGDLYALALPNPENRMGGREFNQGLVMIQS
jgi:predicted nucleotidyltransferase